MRRFLTTLLALLVATSAWCQTEEAAPTTGTRFMDNEPIAAALTRAKEEGKQLFVDCYTTWCGPCRMMTSQVFPLDTVGQFMNAHFVCLKVDMEKGEGPDLAARYEVRAYPTFLILDKDGKEVNRLVGANSPAGFLESVAKAMQGSRLPELESRWNAGERSMDFLRDYYEELNAAYRQDKASEVVEAMLEGRTSEIISDSTLFKAWLTQRPTPQKETYQYVWQHIDDVKARYGEKVAEYLGKMWLSWPSPSNLGTMLPDSTYAVDKQKLADYEQLMERMDVPNRQQVIDGIDVKFASVSKDGKGFVKKAEKYMKKYGQDDTTLTGWARNLLMFCQDKSVRTTVAGWLDQRVKEEMAKVEAAKANPSESRPVSLYTNAFKALAEKLRN